MPMGRVLAKATHRHEDEGSAVIEAVIGVPAFMLFVGLIIFGGRTIMAHQAVESAAADAARTASIARSAGDASGTATAAGAASLKNQQVQCITQSVTVDTAGFSAPVGTPARVTATVTCRVNLSDLSIPGVPGSLTVTESATSPIDTFRER
jgi:Flp pilus assembly protein TadG